VLCAECKTEDNSETVAALKRHLGYPRELKIFRPVGCRACRNTGYHGRHGIFEWMDMNNEIREKILKNCSTGEIREVAIRHGLHSLNEDGWRLVRQGITTPEEVMRATKDQTMENSAKEAATPAEETENLKKNHGLVSV
jgi:type II secretory ATPase GspE/PulE/Tfp pilus assembly ATPase PilB-like protein